MKLLTLLILIIFSTSLKAQKTKPLKRTVKYYKSDYLRKEVNPKKAKFKLIKSEYEYYIIRKEKIRLEDNQLIYSRYYNGNRPTGIWKEYTKRSGIVEINYNDIPYCPYREKAKEGGVDSTKEEFSRPIFEETDADFFRFVAENTRYPAAARDSGIMGTVYLTFKVDTTGLVKDICILKGRHLLLDAEAFRVAQLIHHFKHPAMKNGEPYEIKMTYPAKFSLR